MDLLTQLNSWILYSNNILTEVKFTLFDPNKIQIITQYNSTPNVFDYVVEEKKIILKKKEEVFAIIDKYNQKTLRYVEFKNSKPCFIGLLY